MSYNGYPNQAAFHEAMAARFPAYQRIRAGRLKKNPEGLWHEGCDHAYGICSEGGK
jgi:hypothetical protein